MLLPLPLAAQSLGSERVAHDLPAGAYTLRFLEDPEIGMIDTLQILQGGDLVYEGFFEALVSMLDEPPGSEFGLLPYGFEPDVTGDGRAELVLQSYSGGAHCCFYLSIFELGAEPTLLAEFDGAHAPVQLVELDGDRALEVQLYDWTFAYWKASFADSPAPRVILDLVEGLYAGAPELMRLAPPAPAEIAAQAAAARQVLQSTGKPSSLLWGPMLDYIYSGQAEAAFLLFEQAWPRDLPGAGAFLVQFGAQLSYSPYWDTIAQLNGWSSDE